MSDENAFAVKTSFTNTAVYGIRFGATHDYMCVDTDDAGVARLNAAVASARKAALEEAADYLDEIAAARDAQSTQSERGHQYAATIRSASGLLRARAAAEGAGNG